eukprot:764953-Hanusia_phi.AAC.2
MLKDSLEFSTVGGWIATRASGMKKNVYGEEDEDEANRKDGRTWIESEGELARGLKCDAREHRRHARSCEDGNICGDDRQGCHSGIRRNIGCDNGSCFPNQKFATCSEYFTLFSCPTPQPDAEYGSILFPNFESGVNFMWEVRGRQGGEESGEWRHREEDEDMDRRDEDCAEEMVRKVTNGSKGGQRGSRYSSMATVH